MSDRDSDWVLALGHAVGLDSGLDVPIIPDPKVVRAFLDEYAAKKNATALRELEAENELNEQRVAEYLTTIANQERLVDAQEEDIRKLEAERDKAWSGMTLRDHFAGQALTGLVASFAGIDCNLPPPEKLAHDAYQQADAMLAHRGEGDE